VKDFSYLDRLGEDFATLDMDPETRERTYQELYQGVWEYLLKVVPIRVEGMEKLDVVMKLSETQIPHWINTFNPARKKFLNFISNHARRAAMNVHRDSKETKISRRTYDIYQQITTAVAGGMSMEEACNLYLYHSGHGLRLIKQVETLLKTSLDLMSISMPIYGKDDDGNPLALEGKLVYEEPAFEVERIPAIEIEALPPRYKGLLEQLRPGNNIQLHELDFGRSGMKLVDKLVTLDNAFRMAIQLRSA